MQQHNKNHPFYSHLNQSAGQDLPSQALSRPANTQAEKQSGFQSSQWVSTASPRKAPKTTISPEMQFKVNNFFNTYHPFSGAPLEEAITELPTELTSTLQEKSSLGMKKASHRFVTGDEQRDPNSDQDYLESRLETTLESDQIEALLQAHERNLADARSFSGLIRKLSRETKLAVGIIVFCLFASSIYAGIGYWWLQSGGVSMAAGLKKAVKQSPAFGLFKNIEQLQNENLRSPVQEQATPNPIMLEPIEASPITMLAQANQPSKKTFTLDELKEDTSYPTGRSDPFLPLVKEEDKNNSEPSTSQQPQDTLTLIHFTGVVKDADSTDKVAILKVYDPVKDMVTTYVKKPGETFMANNEKVVLKRIDMNAVELLTANGLKSVSLYPFEDSTTNQFPVNQTSTQSGLSN